MKFANFSYRPGRRRREDGYILLWILMMVFLMTIALMASATSVVQQMRREQEEEMIHRGAQYARAIKKYFIKFHTYPATLEQLEGANNIRCLRQRYKDPMSADGQWHLVRYGEVQMGQGGVSGIGGLQGNASGSGSTNQTNSPFSSLGSGTSGSQTFGGGPIIGVSSTSEKQGIHEFNGKSHYNQWQFIYDPTTTRPEALITGPYQPPQLTPNNLIPGSTPPSGTGTPPSGTGTPPSGTGTPQ